MRILNLQLENFKRISVVEIKPDGNLVQITGKNMQGKSSVLDGIWATLGGADGLQSVPIRRGQDKATLQLKLGNEKVEMIVTRTIRLRDDGTFTTTLTVENADGFRAPTPQKMLDTFLGALTFDPLAFTRMKPKQQFDELRQFVPEIDFDEIAEQNDTDYQARTDVNRDAKRARAAADLVEVPDSIDAETQPVDEAALTEELAGAGKHNTEIDREKARREKLTANITTLRAAADLEEAQIPSMVARQEVDRDRQIADHEAAIEQLQRTIKLHEAAIVDARTKTTETIAKDTEYMKAQASKFRTEADQHQAALDNAEPVPEPIDTEELTARIATARWTNAALRKRDERDKHIAEAERLEIEAKTLTEAMAAREKQKADAIAKAELPVEGLGFGDGVVTIRELPFDQASDAEQLRTSIAIAMAANPKLRVIRVRDGSLLDDEGMALLAKMADDKDYQIWIEKVSNDGKVGFVLEDGHIAGIAPPADEPEEKKPKKTISKPRDRNAESMF